MHPRLPTNVIPVLLVLVVSWVWLDRGIVVGHGGDDLPAFHVDEAHKLGEAFYYHLWFQRRDARHPAWTEDFYARTNPPVAKYIFGAVLAAAGHPVRDLRLQDAFGKDWQTPDRLRRAVPDDMLRVTRGISVAFGAGVCALLFLIARRAAGLMAGLIAVLLLLGNPSFTETARRGLTDTILLFHLTLIVPVTLAAVHAFRRHWQRRQSGGVVRRWGALLVWTVLAPGLAIALATGSKLNGWLTGPSYVAGLMLAALLCTNAAPVRRRAPLACGAAILAVVLSIVIFVGINPYLHADPIRRMATMRDTWADWLLIQQIFPGPGLFTVHQRVSAVAYYSLYDVPLPLSRLADALHVPSLGGPLAAFGCAAGLVYLVGRCLPLPRDGGAGPPAPFEEQRRLDAAVILCWVAVCTTGITLWLPLLWDRHLLPPYLTICVMTAVGLGALPVAARAAAARLSAGSKDGSPMRFVAGGLATFTLWIILAFTPWVVVPMLLPDPMTWSDPDAVDTEADSPVLHGNIGFMFQQLGMDRQATEQYETALALLDRESARTPCSVAQRCRILRPLADTRAAMGDRAGEIDALRQCIAVLEELRNRMASTDPFVRKAYEEHIAEDRAELVRRLSGGRPGG